MLKNLKNKLTEIPIFSTAICSALIFTFLYTFFTSNSAAKCIGTIEQCGWQLNQSLEKTPLYEPSLTLAFVLAVSSILISIPFVSELYRSPEEKEEALKNLNEEYKPSKLG